MSTPSLAGPSKDFLCYLTGVSLEKLLRLDRILDRQHEALEVEYHGVIATLKEAVSRSKELLADNSTVIGEILGDPEVDELQRLALATTLQNIVRFFYGIHEYFVFLPREAVEREVFFALRNCFGGEWDRAQPSVILTSIYNAFEYRF